MEPTEQDLIELQKLYDEVHALRRSAPKLAIRASYKSDWEILQYEEAIEYMKRQIDGEWMTGTLWGTVCYYREMGSSNHIANVVLRQYIQKIRPYKVAFGQRDRVPEEIWKYVVERIKAMKVLSKDWTPEHDEQVRRYDGRYD